MNYLSERSTEQEGGGKERRPVGSELMGTHMGRNINCVVKLLEEGAESEQTLPTEVQH